MAQLPIGALRAAEANLRRSIALCREIEDAFAEAVGHQELGRVLAYRGAWAESEEELATAMAMFEKENNTASLRLWTQRYRSLRALLLARAQALAGKKADEEVAAALAAARRALELAEENGRMRLSCFSRLCPTPTGLLGAAHRLQEALWTTPSAT